MDVKNRTAMTANTAKKILFAGFAAIVFPEHALDSMLDGPDLPVSESASLSGSISFFDAGNWSGH